MDSISRTTRTVSLVYWPALAIFSKPSFIGIGSLRRRCLKTASLLRFITTLVYAGLDQYLISVTLTELLLEAVLAWLVFAAYVEDANKKTTSGKMTKRNGESEKR